MAKVPTPEPVDELIDSLRGEGVRAEPGEFTLDRKVALEKLEKYQLVDPQGYVLELVQAARLKGATYIDFDIDTDDMRMRFDGRPFTGPELKEVYGSVFRSERDDDTRALQQLALGLNGARGLRPRWIRVESGAGGELSRLQIRGRRGVDRITQTQQEPSTLPEGRAVVTEIHVKGRLRLALIRRFFANLATVLPEQLTLHERCRFASFEIRLNGHPISHGLTLPTAAGREPIDGEGIQGEAGLTAGLHPPRVHWVLHGALICTEELPEQGGEGFEAVVEVNGLRKDVSQANVVHDEQYTAALHRVRVAWAKLKRDPGTTKRIADKRQQAAQQELASFYPGMERTFWLLRVAGYGSTVGVGILYSAEVWVPAMNYFTKKWWIWVPAILLTGGFLWVTANIANRVSKSYLTKAMHAFEQRFPKGSPLRPHAVQTLRSQVLGGHPRLAAKMLAKL